MLDLLRIEPTGNELLSFLPNRYTAEVTHCSSNVNHTVSGDRKIAHFPHWTNLLNMTRVTFDNSQSSHNITVVVVGNGFDDSNPERSCLRFTLRKCSQERHEYICSPFSYW